MNDRVVIYRSAGKACIIILAGIALAIAGLLVLLATRDTATGWMIIIAAAFVLVLGIGSLSDRKPHIVLTGRGMTEMFTVREEIEWDAMVYVDDFWFRGQDFIRILLPADYKPGLIRPTWFYRLDKLYERQGVKAIYIRAAALQVSPGRLTALFNEMIKADPAQRQRLIDSFNNNKTTVS